MISEVVDPAKLTSEQTLRLMLVMEQESRKK